MSRTINSHVAKRMLQTVGGAVEIIDRSRASKRKLPSNSNGNTSRDMAASENDIAGVDHRELSPTSGYIEVYGYHGAARGLFFVGSMTDPGEERDRPQEIKAHFERSEITSGILQALYPREDVSGSAVGFVASFHECASEPHQALVALEIQFPNSCCRACPSAKTLRLQDRDLAEHVNRVLAAQQGNSTTNRVPTVLSETLSEQALVLSALEGFVDFYGYHSTTSGWLFCGWLAEAHRIDPSMRSSLVAEFEQGTVAGEFILAVYPRSDLAEDCEGVAFFVPGPPGPLGALRSIILQVGKLSWTLQPGTPLQRLREHELIAKMRRALAGAPQRLECDTLLAFINREPYSGHNTLATLGDPVPFAIDEAILCKPDSVVLIGWCLASPAVVRNIRVRSGSLASSFELGECIWIDRPDVLEALGTQFGARDPRCGFIGFVPHSVSTNSRTYVEIETIRGEIGYIPVPPFKLEGMAAIKAILQPFEFRFTDLAPAFDGVIGPAIQMLSRTRLSMAPRVDNISYGNVPSHPRFSVVVPLYGRIDFAEYQLALFSEYTPNQDVEFIYVLDDPSKRLEAQQLFYSTCKRFRLPVRLLLLDRNVGFAPASNLGLSVAKGVYVAFVNSDVFPGTPDWLERLANDLLLHPKLGAIGPLLLYEDGTVQHQGISFERMAEFGDFFFPQHVGKGRHYSGGVRIRNWLCITGACMLIHRSIACKLGGFDESYLLGDFEDTDLCLRLHQMNLQCAVDPQVCLYHLERKSQESASQRWRMNLSLYNGWLHHQRWDLMIENYQSHPEHHTAADALK